MPYVREQQEKRLRAAERALSLLGRVNPLALEEFAALEERHKFLTDQLADLKKSRADLLVIVKEIDERVEQVFAEAYRDTAAAFDVVFPRLFPGGEGRLVLTDPDNMLTTGIDVEARPAGKKVKRLSLLSGGERSLTAVAMLVAIFKARPSPFYVMDEVEAALDDANLGRLLEIFRELQEDSQLIVVTHQKRTMEIADALYGVTMRGDGVTTVISQRMREDADRLNPKCGDCVPGWQRSRPVPGLGDRIGTQTGPVVVVIGILVALLAARPRAARRERHERGRLPAARPGRSFRAGWAARGTRDEAARAAEAEPVDLKLAEFLAATADQGDAYLHVEELGRQPAPRPRQGARAIPGAARLLALTGRLAREPAAAHLTDWPGEPGHLDVPARCRHPRRAPRRREHGRSCVGAATSGTTRRRHAERRRDRAADGSDGDVLDRAPPVPPASEHRPRPPRAARTDDATSAIPDDVAEADLDVQLDVPAPVAGRFARLRGRLARSGSPLGTRLLAVLSRDHLTEDDWDELEETLLLADVGAGPTGDLHRRAAHARPRRGRARARCRARRCCASSSSRSSTRRSTAR